MTQISSFEKKNHLRNHNRLFLTVRRECEFFINTKNLEKLLLSVIQTYVEPSIFVHVISILTNQTLRLYLEIIFGYRLPPIVIFSILVEISSKFVKSMCDFVTNRATNGTVVQVLRSVLIEVQSVEHSSKNFYSKRKITFMFLGV